MILTLEQIRYLVDDRYIERGRAYTSAGQIKLTEVTPDRVTAKCSGTRMYDVMLWLKGKRLSGHCTCPAVDDYGPCKHIAATALAVMAQDYSPSPSFLRHEKQITRVQNRLLRMSKAELAALIMQLVPDEEELEYILSEDDE